MENRSGTPYAQWMRRSYIRDHYPAWIEGTRPMPTDITRLRHEVSGFWHRPTISIVLPVYDPKRKWLEQALDSLLGQIYPDWELCVIDDASKSPHVQEILSFYERLDGRIKVHFMDRNAGISMASNAGLEMATGEFVGLLDHDDELPPDALFQVAKLLQEKPEADLIYSDVDKIDEEGERSDPNFKPGWSPDLLMSSNYISHLGVYRNTILKEIGGFRSEFDGCQDYDLVLRFTEKTQKIFHIPKILYHWRTVEGSVAKSSTNKAYISDKARRALTEALERRGLQGSVEDGLLPNRFRVKLEIDGEPKVRIIIPTRNNASSLRRCIESIERLTRYGNYEILIVDNKSDDPATVEYLASTPHEILQFEGEYNHSKMNNRAVAGVEHLLFLEDNTEVISGEWLEEMLRYACRLDVGAVGAKLFYPDGRIQHAGILTGVGQPWLPAVATHSHRHYPADSSGYVGAAKVARNYSAVSAACMMVRRVVFEESGGFDEENLQMTFNDVDLCLKMRERGYVTVYTPFATLFHHESKSREVEGTIQEAVFMRERWGETLDNDPYYNPNFSLGSGDFNLRADLLRPKLLASDNEYSCASGEDPRLLDDEEFGKYLRNRQRTARSSRMNSLVPKLSNTYSKLH